MTILFTFCWAALVYIIGKACGGHPHGILLTSHLMDNVTDDIKL